MNQAVWLEEAGNANRIRLFDIEPVQKDKDVKMTYNDNEYLSISSPIAITFEYGFHSYKNEKEKTRIKRKAHHSG